MKEISKFIPKLSSVCKNEKVRVCYINHQLSEKIDKGSRTEWIGAISGIQVLNRIITAQDIANP